MKTLIALFLIALSATSNASVVTDIRLNPNNSREMLTTTRSHGVDSNGKGYENTTVTLIPLDQQDQQGITIQRGEPPVYLHGERIK